MGQLAVLIVALAMLSGAFAVSSSEKQQILKKHNDLRGQVQPSASNMLKMHWNDNLARHAEKFISTCPDNHDDSNARKKEVGLGISVGQNLAWNYPSWDASIQAWYDEVKDFRYGGQSGWGVLHFTQMTQALSAHIGCAFKDCGSGHKWKTYYVCDYSYMQINTERPWESGKSCSKCGGKCSGNLCDCGDKLCSNGGTLDPSTCSCKCSGIYSGSTCEKKNCKPDPDYCGKPQPMGFERKHCDMWTNVPDECPNMCGLC